MRVFRRGIKLKILFSRGMIYRAFIISMNFLFNLIAFKGLLALLAENFFGSAIAYTIVWNLINTGLYYLFHYCFDRNFKIGKEK